MKSLRSITIFLLLLMFAPCCFSQQQDLRKLSDAQFLEFLRDYRNPAAYTRLRAQGLVAEHEKCGFRINAETMRRYQTMSQSDRALMKQILAPPATDTSVFSPSGRFKIHFNLTGPATPSMLGPDSTRLPNTAFEYARAVALYFDSSYVMEVEKLGYAAPPFEAGTNWYNVYIIEYNGTYYGETVEADPVNTGSAQQCWSTYILIDNDFAEHYYTRGLSAAKVTAAHEFHHAIQYGYYGIWDADMGDSFFYEMTSTYYENVVYPDVHDYYGYIGNFFMSPETSLYNWPGYQCCLFPKMIEKRYDQFLWKKMLDQTRKEYPLAAMNTVLKTVQSDLPNEFCFFARWNYYTSYRFAQTTTERYDDAASYPKAKIGTSIDIINGQASFANYVRPLATRYLRAINKIDTVIFAVSNRDLQSTLAKSDSAIDYSLTVRTTPLAGSIPVEAKVGNDIVTKFWYQCAHPLNAICVSAFLNEQYPDKGFTSAYPDPFQPERDVIIRFPLRLSVQGQRASLYIYSVSMNLVKKIENVSVRSDEVYGIYLTWDGSTDGGSKAGSGVYFYTIAWNGGKTVGKFALLQGSTN